MILLYIFLWFLVGIPCAIWFYCITEDGKKDIMVHDIPFICFLAMFGPINALAAAVFLAVFYAIALHNKFVDNVPNRVIFRACKRK